MADLGSGAMFDLIARRYDALNRVMSLGLDPSWRRETVRSLGLAGEARVLDLATGTADVALEIVRSHPGVRVVGLDPSENMLAEGRAKVSRAGAAIELVVGDAEALPFEDRSFDGVTMAFGIRNVPDRGKALREMARVLRPGGRVAILELSEPRTGVLAPFSRFYIRQVVPRLGGLVSGSGEYRYLARSIAAFPPASDFVELMRDSGLRRPAARALTLGVVHLYTAEAP